MAFLLLSACSNSIKKLPFESQLSGPPGTKSIELFRDFDHTGYRIILNYNAEGERVSEEKAMICKEINAGQSIKWQLAQLKIKEGFKSPTDLVTLSDGKNIIFYHRYVDGLIWNETDNSIARQIEPLKIHPDKQIVPYIIRHKGEEIDFTSDMYKTRFTVDNKPYELCLGLKRTNLERYQKQYIPPQSIVINNIDIINVLP